MLRKALCIRPPEGGLLGKTPCFMFIAVLTLYLGTNRLGALFDQIIPSTPNLIKVYDQRVSDISALPQINLKVRSSTFTCS